MRFVILAAGASRRYREAGYTTPKPFLEIDWHGTKCTMLQHVLNTIPAEFNYRTVAVAETGWAEAEIGTQICIVTDSRGPAHSALQVLEAFADESTLIMDVDVLNSTNDLYRLSQCITCGVLVSKSTNPGFSYVDRLGTFSQIKEKERISDYAVRGAYYIPYGAMEEFKRRLNAVIAEKDEPYLSHVFHRFKGTKFALETTYQPVDWGTPQDVQLSGARICT